MICVPCTKCGKDQGLFYFNYPQISEAEDSDHVETTQLVSSHICWKNRIGVRPDEPPASSFAFMFVAVVHGVVHVFALAVSKLRRSAQFHIFGLNSSSFSLISDALGFCLQTPNINSPK